MKRLSVFLVLLLCPLFLIARDPGPDKLKALAQQCESLMGGSKLEELNALAREALKLTPANDGQHLAAFYFYIGKSTELPAKYDTAIYYLEKSVASSRKLNDIRMVSRPLRALLLAYYAAGADKDRDRVAQELQAIADTTQDIQLRIDNNGTLANYYGAKGLHQKQLDCLLEDLAFYKKKYADGKDRQRLSGYIAEDLLKIAELYYINLDQPERSIGYLNEARPYVLPEDEGSVVFYHKFYADALVLMGKVADALPHYDSVTQMCLKGSGMACNIRFALDLMLANHYLDQSENDKASGYIGRARELAPMYAQDPTSMAQLAFSEAKMHMGNRAYSVALPFLKDAEEKANSVSFDFCANVQGALAQCYAGLGQWQQAYDHAQKKILFQDSIYAEKAKQSLANAEAKYQNKNKQQQIEAQETELAYASRQRLWLIAGLSLAALVALLLVLIYRNKKRAADVLDEKNKKLAQLNDDLEEANRTKAKLFGIISHDLRSPISQVYQFLKLQQLDPGRLTEEQKTRLSNKIQTATGSLLETMEDLLLWSKTQMNAFVPEIQPTVLKPVLDQCLSLLRLNIEAKHITVHDSIPEEVEVSADPYFLQTIFRNLLQNAVKASPEQGNIWISHEMSGGTHMLSITNEGGRFTQQDYEAVQEQKEDNTSLSGLGLRLVAELSQKTGVRVVFVNSKEETTCAQIIFS